MPSNSGRSCSVLMTATFISPWENGTASIVRLDGLDKQVQRIDLGKIDVTAEMVAAAAPLRAAKAADDALRDEVTVPAIAAKIDGDLSEWPATNWASINPKSSFQLGLAGDKLVPWYAYRTDQDQLLLNSASEFPFAFTQGGGLDLMLRTSGAGDDKNPIAGDIRLFVTQEERARPWRSSIGRKPPGPGIGRPLPRRWDK